MKCDETKPFCWQCSRLEKPCIYEQIKEVPRKRAKKELEELAPGLDSSNSSRSSVSSLLNESNQFPLSATRMNDKDDTKYPTIEEAKYPLEKYRAIEVSKYRSIASLINPPDQESLFDPATELDMLLSDFDGLFGGLYDVSAPESSLEISLDRDRPLDPETKLFPHIALDQIKIDQSHRPYLEYFYNDYWKVIAPFDLAGVVRNMVLSKALDYGYLLNMVLACGAASAYRYLNSAADQQACNRYLNLCNRLLKDTGKEMEPMMVTLLLLTSYNASTKQQSWKPHLSGATRLLKKYQASPVLAVCASWFEMFEVLAGACNLLYDAPRYAQPITIEGYTTEPAVRDSGLLLDNGFNHIFGVFNGMVPCVQRLVKMLNAPQVSIFDTYQLLADFQGQADLKVISADGVVPVSHVLYSNLTLEADARNGKLVMSEAPGVGILHQQNRQFTLHSLYDISHQAVRLACLVLITSTILKVPGDSSLMQQLQDRYVAMMYFWDAMDGEINAASCFDSELQYFFMMIQWTQLAVGMTSTRKLHQEKFFRFFQLMDKLGAGSAVYSMKRLQFIWAGGAYGQNDGKDVVAY